MSEFNGPIWDLVASRAWQSQPRAPKGDPNGGQWVVMASGERITKIIADLGDDLGLTGAHKAKVGDFVVRRSPDALTAEIVKGIGNEGGRLGFTTEVRYGDGKAQHMAWGGRLHLVRPRKS